ncbi:MAG: Spy/CpxP family protein refolding chaperone [Burkholderiaceae bacterium]|nr:Spy/CpxP family protein refolding chaperone [Burkholderiaceae bacterium]
MQVKSIPFSARNLVVAGLLAATGAFAVAQVPAPAPTGAAPTAERRAPPPQGAHAGGPRHQMDRAEMHKRMAERHAQRAEQFKTRLQLTPQQEGAWTTFSAAMKPPARAEGAPRPQREDFAKLTTPQRLDRMQQLKAERDASMARRADATRTFYAQLSPSQQKVFDLETLRAPRHGDHRGGKGPRGHGPAGQHGPARG